MVEGRSKHSDLFTSVWWYLICLFTIKSHYQSSYFYGLSSPSYPHRLGTFTFFVTPNFPISFIGTINSASPSYSPTSFVSTSLFDLYSLPFLRFSVIVCRHFYSGKVIGGWGGNFLRLFPSSLLILLVILPLWLLSKSNSKSDNNRTNFSIPFGNSSH